MEGTFFGPAVIGQEAYDAAKKHQEETAGGFFGPAVRGETTYAGKPVAQAVAEVAEPEVAPESPTMSAEDAVGTIRQNPDAIDRVLDAEFARPDGPRKGVMVAALKSEKAGQARQDVIEKLTAALG